MHAIGAFGADTPRPVVDRLVQDLIAGDPRRAPAASEALRIIASDEVLRALVTAADAGQPVPDWIVATLGRLPPDRVRTALQGSPLLDRVAPMLLTAQGAHWLASEPIGADIAFLLKQKAAVSEAEGDGTLDSAPTDSNPKHGARIDDEEDDYESPPPTLDEIRNRLAGGHAPRFGDPVEAEGRRALRNEIGRLRDELERCSPTHGRIGHNRPPESLSLSVDQTEEVTDAIKELDEETSKAVPDVDAVVGSTGRVGKVLDWFGRKLDVAVDSFMKTFGAALGAGAAAVTAFEGFPLLEAIARVYRAALKWLDAILPLY